MLKKLSMAICLPALLICGTKVGATDLPSIVGNGIVVNDSRNVPAFHAIKCDGSFIVKITAGKKQSLVLKGDSNILPEIKTDVRDRKLHVFSNRSYSTSKSLELTVDMVDINRISLSGTHTAVLHNISNKSLTVEANGASTITVDGNTKKLTASVNGGSNLLAEKLGADQVTISINGAGDAEVYAKKSLEVTITGAGSVLYSGNPVVTKQILGVGDVSRKQ